MMVMFGWGRNTCSMFRDSTAACSTESPAFSTNSSMAAVGGPPGMCKATSAVLGYIPTPCI